MPHPCRWPGCREATTDRLWACRNHWYTLPIHLRDKLWAAYQPKQWKNGQLSPAYVEAERLAQAWIAQNTFADERGEQPSNRSAA